jgi:ATP-dependent RNA helicase HelY
VNDLSPAERYAQSQLRSQTPLVSEFRARRTFDLDPFQIAAASVLEAGKSVLVAAPTGAGKTVVAEFAVFLTMNSTQDKLFYTTPMKALSNQKYNEFVEEWGSENVGILTGDTNINSNARIVVMTTEVLRNMLYADSDTLDNLRFVVMDEVHYLADRFRGAVWEEVIIHLPAQVRLVSLSATVSNAEEFGDWLQAVRGETEIIVSEDRPIPLDQHVLIGNKFIDLFDSASAAAAHRANPELARLALQNSRTPHIRGAARNSNRGGKNNRHNYSQAAPLQGRMERADVIEMLGEKNLLPAIFFVFSRAGCDQAVNQVLRAGISLTTAEEAGIIRDLVDERCKSLNDEDLGVLGYWDWVDALERGVAAHHAGLLPIFKEVVEELFQRKLVKAVFATETLALGINMPARSVVLEKLEKFNGEARVPLTPGEYTQLTGRAGRRGIDVEGHSVIQWSSALDPTSVANLASKRTYPLNSSFRPTYNMAINLIEKFGRARTREILESSFAQFQADRAVVDIARKVKQQEVTLAGYAEPVACHLGDFASYAEIRRSLTDLEKQSESGSKAARDKRASELADLRRQLKTHNCHHCPDREQHARWAERWWRLHRDTQKLTSQISTRTNAVARVFDHVCEVLVDMDYLMKDPHGDDVALTPKGEKLGGIYGERDLLVAEAIRLGLWENLDASALAAMACAVIFEPRREEGTIHERHLPQGNFIDALHETQSLWNDLEELETFHQLPGTQPLATGLCLAMYKWAKGARLTDVLFDADMPAGDFVRWSKQTIDLLDQLSQASDGRLKATARKALDSVRRGIVAFGISA